MNLRRIFLVLTQKAKTRLKITQKTLKLKLDCENGFIISAAWLSFASFRPADLISPCREASPTLVYVPWQQMPKTIGSRENSKKIKQIKSTFTFLDFFSERARTSKKWKVYTCCRRSRGEAESETTEKRASIQRAGSSQRGEEKKLQQNCSLSDTVSYFWRSKPRAKTSEALSLSACCGNLFFFLPSVFITNSSLSIAIEAWFHVLCSWFFGE